MKTNVLLPLVLFVAGALSAQEKGSALPNELTNHQTRAVVVGISDYQDDAIPDLQYAHRDAEAFANFLRSPAGGGLDRDHLKVLINEQATTAQFDAALGWLIDESKEGDEAIIYFSGHGDVETKTRSQQGFLLCWDSPPQAYVSGAYPIFFLKEVISTLSLENKARVIVITDACRAGKLAGNTIGGSQLTSQNLAQQFAGEIKILSCQPNEYSVEGEQWGGGRGAFSWHLINALYGLADQDEDDRVTVKEMNRYLEDRVPAETAPEKQNPMVLGDRETRLAKVAPEILAALRKSMGDQMLSFSPLNNRGLEDEVLAGVDSNVRALYRLFQKALKDKAFFEPATVCVDVYYEKLTADPGLARLHNSMRRNYAAALQDDAQQVMNIWLRTDVQELECIGKSLKLNPIPVQLERAAELLGPDHYMYKSLIARKFLFEAAVLYDDFNSTRPNKELALKCLALCHRSLEYEPRSAITYYRMGLSYGYHLRQLDSAFVFMEEAHRLAPSWVRPFTQLYYIINTATKKPDQEKMVLDRAIAIDSSHGYVLSALGTWYTEQRKFKEAEKTFSKYEAVGGSTYPCWYVNRGYSFKKLGKFAEAEIQFKKAIALDSTHTGALNHLGLLLYHQSIRRYAEAESHLKKAIALDSTYVIAWNNLGNLYQNTRRYAEAEFHLKKAIALDSTYAIAWNNLGNLYQNTRRYAEAESHLKKAIALDSTYVIAWNNLGNLYQITRRYTEAEFHFKKAIALDSTYAIVWSNLGRLYQDTRRYAEAEFPLKKAITLDSTNATRWNNLAVLYTFTNRYATAKPVLKRAIALDSTHFNAWNNLGFTCLHLNELPEAEQALQRAIQLDSTYANSRKHLATVFLRLGRIVEARQGYQKALELNPNYFGCYLGMAYLFAVEGKSAEALDWLEQAIQKGVLYEEIQDDADLDTLRDLPEFKALMKKYFPDRIKD